MKLAQSYTGSGISLSHNGLVLAKCRQYKLKFKAQTICGILPILCYR